MRARLFVALSALLLLGTFLVPLWRIQLHAPQYPEGLGMLIRLNTITGIKPADLDNINGLNHYIGMKAIDPGIIPVLRMMPWVVGGLAIFAALTALTGLRSLLAGWLVSFALAGVGGLVEFYRWSYDYGHNLAPDAVIKVPGMTYQPPLIGSKQLLNFVAESWPAAGSWFAISAFLLGCGALWLGMRRVRVTAAPLAAALAALMVFAPGAGAQARARLDSVVVAPTGPVRSIAAALRMVRAGGRVIVTAGTYREPVIEVSEAVEIVGRGAAILDGRGEHGLMLISADDVTVRGLTFAHVGTSFIEDRAALRVAKANHCIIQGNRFEDAFFGIYLASVEGCRIEDNVLSASNKTETSSGNGIHLWSSRDVVIASNRVSGFRDGIYFEFVHDTEVRDNVSEGNLRYGLHFMYSDDCRYLRNTFHGNGSGVAVMYTHRVQMTGNRFEKNWGAAAYGLLLKEISDARLEHNVFTGNTTGLVADGANRMVADRNDFVGNGWAVKLDASTIDARMTRNNFVANTFDVSSDSRAPSTVLKGNYWDAYRGYDLDGNGVGDVPFRPVRLFSMIVERHESALLLLRSAFVELLDTAERVMPAMTPTTLADASPSMRRLQ
ncbi:MAG: nitrous oxide reductase family maturation protein NosD [Gemmatimonadaceae bacterium]